MERIKLVGKVITLLLILGFSKVYAQSYGNHTIGRFTTLTGYVYANGTSNLTSLTQAQVRTDLGLVIGTDVQAYSARLTDIAALSVTDNNIMVGNGSTWVAESGATARASLGLSIGTNVQAWDADLDAISALANTDGNFIVGNGSTWVAESGATVRTSLGLGSLATLSTINNSNWSGTDLALTNGGTGSSTASGARTNLGLVIGTNVQAYDADLTAVAALGSTGIAVRSASNTWVQRTLTGTSNEITVTNGSGASGNPTISMPSALTFTGKTITGGTYTGATYNGVDLTTAGSATNFLNEQGDYVVAGSGDVTAASSFGTDNSLILSDGTGKGVKSSGIGLIYEADNFYLLNQTTNNYADISVYSDVSGFLKLKIAGSTQTGTLLGANVNGSASVNSSRPLNIYTEASASHLRIGTNSSLSATIDGSTQEWAYEADADYQGNDITEVANITRTGALNFNGTTGITHQYNGTTELSVESGLVEVQNDFGVLGNSGFGVAASANQRMYVYRNATMGIFGFDASDLNAAGVRIEDSAGSLYLDGNAIISDVNAVMSIGTTQSTSLVFGTDNTERVRIDATGRVGIGTTPSANLHVIGNINTTGSRITQAYFTDHTTTNAETVDSDERLKKDITPLTGATDKILAMSAIKYKWDEKKRSLADTVEHYGFSAQEIREILPSVVTAHTDSLGNEVLGVRYSEIIPFLIEAIKELNTEIENLKLSK